MRLYPLVLSNRLVTNIGIVIGNGTPDDIAFQRIESTERSRRKCLPAADFRLPIPGTKYAGLIKVILTSAGSLLL